MAEWNYLNVKPSGKHNIFALAVMELVKISVFCVSEYRNTDLSANNNGLYCSAEETGVTNAIM